MQLFNKFGWIILSVFSFVVLWMSTPQNNDEYNFKGDDLRYISYAVSLYEHGIFGLSTKDLSEAPKAGNANAPLYPAMIAGTMLIDQKFAQSLKCAIENKKDVICSYHFQTFFILQILLSIITITLIYYIALYVTKNFKIAWIAAFLSLMSGIFQEFSYVFMTESLLLPLSTALLFVCLIAYQKKNIRWGFLIGILLAVLTLVRPSYLYLFYGFVLFLTIFLLFRRNRSSFLIFLSLVFGFSIIVSPWAWRNKIQFDSYTLTSGSYAEAILIQRTNYNQMSLAESGVALIYWLPDFGDSLAKKIFPRDLYHKLSWEEGSYYAQQYQDKMSKLSEELGGKDKIIPHLIKEEILTLKHAIVSIPLALRGIFIAKYWGLLGFIAFIFLLIQTTRKKDYRILILSLPLFYMIAFHAGLSVSIPRYNLSLVALYALSMAYYIHMFIDYYGTKLIKKF